MPRRPPGAPHLSLDDVRQRERPVPAGDRVSVLAMRLMAEGRPATEVGPLVDAAVATQVFPDIPALEDARVTRCQLLEGQPNRLCAHTHCRW